MDSRCLTGANLVNPTALLLLALAMATDAFAAAIGKGASIKKRVGNDSDEILQKAH